MIIYDIYDIIIYDIYDNNNNYDTILFTAMCSMHKCHEKESLVYLSYLEFASPLFAARYFSLQELQRR